MWQVYIALFVVFIYVLDQFLLDKRLYELAEKFNGPKRWPLIGTAYTFFGVGPKGQFFGLFVLLICLSQLFIVDYYGMFVEKMNTYARSGNRVSRFWIGNKVEIHIDDPKHLEAILTNPKFLSKSFQYNFLSVSLGEGLLFSTNKKWFGRRRVITPTFHFKILEQFFEVFVKHNQVLMANIQEKANGKIFDIFPLITASVMNSICGNLNNFQMNFFYELF